MARRGQKGWICTRESIVVCERGDFAHVDCRARIIVDFDVVIIDPIAGINVPHRQTGSTFCQLSVDHMALAELSLTFKSLSKVIKSWIV